MLGMSETIRRGGAGSATRTPDASAIAVMTPAATWRPLELFGPLRLTLDQLDDVLHHLAQISGRLLRAVGLAGLEGIFEIGHRDPERLQETPCAVLGHASLQREDVVTRSTSRVTIRIPCATRHRARAADAQLYTE